MITLKPARRACVPLVVIETADPAQTVKNIILELNGQADKMPVMRWDICNGLMPGIAPESKKPFNTALAACRKIAGQDHGAATVEPFALLMALFKLQENDRGIVFMFNAHRFWVEPPVMQAIWNLRDYFKGIGSTLVMLCQSAHSLPDELKTDCVVLTESLPTSEEVLAIVDDIAEGSKLKKVTEKEKVCDALLGLPAFAAEQVMAMSIVKDGNEVALDRPGLWERKRKMIEQTPGLSVWRGGETFDQIGGYKNVKGFMRDICAGRKPPRAIVFIDEIEKSMAASGSDTSGVSQDYLRCLLTFMQDRDAAGVIFIGPPGSGKSVVAKATGNDAGIPTVVLDLGGMKGSLVGESERRLRSALQVVEAVSQGQTLFIATCNSIGILPPELRRRFSLGTFFFPLPSEEDRPIIWDIWQHKYEIKGQKLPPDDGWTGAEIHNACMMAWRLKRSLIDAAKFIVPVSVSAADQIDRLCRDAHNRYISASVPGLYEYEKMLSSGPTGRKIT